MCCRYYMELSPELRPIIEEANRAPLTGRMVAELGRPLVTSGEIFPTNLIVTVASSRSGARTVFPMQWGYHLPRSSRPLVNARSESAAQKPVFRDSWLNHRCAIPMSWYFEWEHLTRPDGKTRTGDKYLIQPRGLTVSWMAGLYRLENGLPSCVILTRDPGPELLAIHDRMPVILPACAVDDWINPAGDPEPLLSLALTDVCLEKCTETKKP